jgi:DNA-directed RNA polymerase specialized sigma24 family protein
MNGLDTRQDADLLADRDVGGESFAVFYRRHVDVVLRLCARRGLQAGEAADVTAETFAAALLARGSFRTRITMSG